MKEMETVKAIIHRENQNFLLLKLRNRDVWQFVTGHIEGGESKLETVKREMKEEVGLEEDKIESIKRMDIKDSFCEKNYKITSTLFLVEVGKDFDVDIYKNPEEEHEDFEWIRKEQVSKKLNFSNQKDFFEMVIKFLENIQKSEN
ncbi:MAG: NUDIX domain-containing protein [Candidatus Aenigmatarchaeota archaeon]